MKILNLRLHSKGELLSKGIGKYIVELNFVLLVTLSLLVLID